MIDRCRSTFLILTAVFLSVAVFQSSGCGGGSTPTPTSAVSPIPAPTSASSIAHDRVFIVVLENEPYSAVVGNSSMPFFNGLARNFGLATNYFANAHPSLPNYFVLTVGQTEGT